MNSTIPTPTTIIDAVRIVRNEMEIPLLDAKRFIDAVGAIFLTKYQNASQSAETPRSNTLSVRGLSLPTHRIAAIKFIRELGENNGTRLSLRDAVDVVDAISKIAVDTKKAEDATNKTLTEEVIDLRRRVDVLERRMGRY